MTAWAVAGQSLGLVVGGAGLGMALGFGGMLWVERNRAGDLQDAVLARTLENLNAAAELSTCRASQTLLREGREIDNAIQDSLLDFTIPDDWRVQPPASD